MMKRVIALLLCLVTLLFCVTACAKDENDKGAYIRMYLSEPIYDFDPLAAFDNTNSLQIVSLLFTGLFKADENGNPKKDLVDEYKYVHDKDKDRYYLTLTLRDTRWSDGVKVSASHVQYSFLRLFASNVSHPATALLYDVKNARAIADGDLAVDHLGVVAKDQKTVEIEFEHNVDVDTFLQVLCSPALYPMRDDIVDFNADWAKKTSTMVCSGPFLVRRMDYGTKDGFVLERNNYYYRDREKNDAYDKYVKPFRLVCDFTTDIETQLANFNSKETGAIFFLGNIPLAGRTSGAFAPILKKGKLTDNASTHVYYLNENAEIGGTTLFADKNVRQAMSLALDRAAIAEALVFAEAADGLVPHTILNRADKSKEFRKKADAYLSADADIAAAKQLLQAAGVNASSYSFTITVRGQDTDHVATAEMAKAAWEQLGFRVTVNATKVYETRDAAGELTGIYADPYKIALDTGAYEVIALDLIATAPSAYGYLAPFAAAFSGNAITIRYTEENGYTYSTTPHSTGYNSAAYNEKIEAAYAEQKEGKRAKLLHEAETILMDDMPVIPVVYNKDFAAAGSKLGKVESTYFCNAYFIKTSLSGYWKIALAENFIFESDDN